MTTAQFNQKWKSELFERACRWLPEEAPSWKDRIAGWPEPILAGKKEDELRRLGVFPEGRLEIPLPTGVRCSRLIGGECWRPLAEFRPGCEMHRRMDVGAAVPLLSVSEADGGGRIELYCSPRDSEADAGWHLYHVGGQAADERGVVGEAGENLLLKWEDGGAAPDDASRAALLAGEDPSGEALKVLLDSGRVAAAWELAREWVESSGWRKSFPVEGPEHDPDWVKGRRVRGLIWLIDFHATMIRLALEAETEAGDRFRGLRRDIRKPLQTTFFALVHHDERAKPA